MGKSYVVVNGEKTFLDVHKVGGWAGGTGSQESRQPAATSGRDPRRAVASQPGCRPGPCTPAPQVPALSPRQLKLLGRASWDKDASAVASTAEGMIQVGG